MAAVCCASDSAMTSPEATLVSGKYEEMMELLQGYCEQVYAVWASGADQDCLFHLEQPLIHRDPSSSLISVNFNRKVMPAVMHLDAVWSYIPPNILHLPNKHCLPHGVFLQLTAVLREVKYLGFQKQKDIPVGAEKLFAQKETLQKFVDNLDLMTGWYNKASGWCWCWSVSQVLSASRVLGSSWGGGSSYRQVPIDREYLVTTGLAFLQVKQTALPVELPLVAAELEAIDGRLVTAEQSLCWNHDGMSDAGPADGSCGSWGDRPPSLCPKCHPLPAHPLLTHLHPDLPEPCHLHFPPS